MPEKRYKSNKYIHCYCKKNEEILVGHKWYRFENTVLIVPGCVFFFFFSAMGYPDLSGKIIISMCVLGVPILLARSSYKDAKKIMLEAGHTDECSHKITRLSMMYTGMYSDFKIMKEKDD